MIVFGSPRQKMSESPIIYVHITWIQVDLQRSPHHLMRLSAQTCTSHIDFRINNNDNVGCAWAWIAQNSPKLINLTDGSTWNRTWNDGTSPCWAADGKTCRIPPMRLLPCLGIWGIQPFVCSSYILDNQLLILNHLCHMDQAFFDNALIDRCLWITFLNLFYHFLGPT